MTAGQALAASIALAVANVSNAPADSPVAPALLFDFYPGEFHDAPPVSALQRVGDRLFFIAGDRDTPPQLWVSEGDPATTRRVSAAGLFPTHSAAIAATLDDRVIWRSTSDAGKALWATDRAGVSVQLRASVGASFEGNLEPPVLQGRYYFPVCALRCILWSTDGSVQGTRAESTAEPFQANPSIGSIQGRRLLFLSTTGVSVLDPETGQTELVLPVDPSLVTPYATDGSVFLRLARFDPDATRHELWSLLAGERRAHRFYRSALGLEVQGFRAGRLYFVDRSASTDWLYAPLWSSDGTREGTVKLEGELVPSTFSTFANQLGSAGVHGLLAGETYSYKWHHYGGGLFQIDDQQLRVDRVSNCSSSAPLTDFGSSTFGSCNGRLFRADGSGLDLASRLFEARSDLVREIDGRLVVGAKSRDGQPQLWETDGTTAGTRSLSGRPKGPAFNVSGPAAALDGSIFVAATRVPVGQQLFRVDRGVTEPLTQLKHFGKGIDADWVGDVEGARLVFSGSELLSVRDGAVHELPSWVEGCLSCPVAPVRLGQRLLHRQDYHLSVTDGTLEGTRPVRPTREDARCANALDEEGRLEVSGFARLGDRALIFDADGGLWTTDGSDAGTTCLTGIELPPGCLYGSGSDLEWSPGLSSDWLFLAFNSTTGRTQIWRTDGSEGGTFLLANLDKLSTTGGNPAVVRAGELGYLIAGDRLAVSDGTPEGTRVLDEIPHARPIALASIDDQVLVSFDSGLHQILSAHHPGTATWTDLGAFARIDLSGSSPVDGALFFVATPGNTSTATGPAQLWRSDGTPTGTTAIPEAPSPTNKLDNPLTVAGGRVYFTGCEPSAGCELWSVASGGNGARLHSDFWAGPRSSDPIVVGDTEHAIYFSATDPDVGREVWTIPKN